jgi:alkaline phosphatase D
VEVEGLEPAREYFYRFTCGDATSKAGRTRTAPRTGQGDDKMRFAFASCQQYEQGFYAAHRHLVADAPDLVLFLGDYIYESSWGRDKVRQHNAAAPFTLADYRNRYALYKTDPDLQRAHAAAPWIVTWDDHEVENDYANDRGETLDPQFLARRTAAYRAFLEHMPLRKSVLRDGGEIRIYDRFAWGSLALFHVLDDRQYRSHQVCPKPGRGGSNVVGDECAERLDPKLTLLGAEQEAWLEQGFAQSRATWNVITQQTLFSPAGGKRNERVVHWTDGWDGYPAARERMLDSITRARPANPLIIGGDVHAQYFANVRGPMVQGRAPILAAELCGTSITSQGPSAKVVDAILAENADIRWANGSMRGYTLVDLTRTGMEAKLRALDNVKRADSGIRTAATYHAVAGRAGLVE